MFRCLLACLAIFALALAKPAFPLVILLPEGEEAEATPFPLTEQEVTVRIDGRVARTNWKLTYHNPHPNDREGTFFFTLPPNAQVSDFAVKIDGEELRAEVLPREEARGIYERIVRRMRDPGLLEYVNDRTMRLRVFPLRAGKDSLIEIEYLQTLVRENELVSYSISQVFPGGLPKADRSRISATIHSDSPIGLVQSPTHKISVAKKQDDKEAHVTLEEGEGFAGEFALLFAESNEGVDLHILTYRAAGEEEGTFLLLVNPPSFGARAEPISKDVVFVLDTSGSMAGPGKIGKAQEAMVQCLEALNPHDRFALIEFSTASRSFRPELLEATRENIDAATEWLRSLRARGGTNIHDALADAVTILEPKHGGRVSTLRQIVFFTDGMPTVGRTDPVQILEAIPEQSHFPIRVFPLGFGYDVNTHLLDDMAERGGAFSTYIHPEEDLEITIAGFFKSISHPVLTDVSLHAGMFEILEQYPPHLPDLFLGREVMVAGKFRGKGTGDLTLSGLKGFPPHVSTSIRFELPESSSRDREYIRAIWANRKVGYLLDQIRRVGYSDELRDEIVALATEFRLVTPYTSYLAAPDHEYGTVARASARTRFDDQRRASATAVDEWAMMAPAEAMTARSGRQAVTFAEGLRGQMEADTVSRGDIYRSRQAQRDSGMAVVQGLRFEQNSAGVWVQQTGAAPENVVQIKYLSPAYFELLDRFPEARQQVVLGERVQLVINGQWIEIGEEGIEDSLPAL